MNRYAYRTTGLAIKTLSGLSRAKVNLHGRENLPDGPAIFVINHFTRIETLLMPYTIDRLTRRRVWSLAASSLFNGPMSGFLDKVGAVSTRAPDRDRLIVKTLLTGDASWIIFPEGRMVKSKKVFDKGRFIVSSDAGRRAPHTGAATLALRTEFYRRRLHALASSGSAETTRLLDKFGIENMDAVFSKGICIVPVNITYYPIHARENMLSKLAAQMIDGISERMVEELMTEGTMLLSGVDVDVRFGQPIAVGNYLAHAKIGRDISRPEPIGFDDPIASRKILRKVAVRLMQRYMSDIYSMTTVNYDHLFASMLRALPFNRFHTDALRRKVFLAASQNLAGMNIFFHDNLSADQLHLITDDRFQRFQEFVRVALEKGVIRQDGDFLIRDRQRLLSGDDFHRVRVENPVAVMANEVEPLEKMQRCIRRIAWQPGFWQRHRISVDLLKAARAEFEQDYEAFFRAGESKDKAVGRPFLIRGKSRKTGVVLIHGYMAAPLEVRELAEYLGKLGLWVYVPRLKGHGTSPDDLAVSQYTDWIQSVEQGYALMHCICRQVVVGGFSTGAGLALELAARISGLAGVFAVSPPLRLQDFSSRFAPAVDAWNRLMKKIHIEGAKMEFVENSPENPHINYFRNPIAGVRELDHLMDAVEQRLADIRIPALVVQSHKDPVVDPAGSRKVFERIGSEDKKYVLFNYDRHGILLGPGAARVHRVIGEFIDYLQNRKIIVPQTAGPSANDATAIDER